jgi:hypothetical protein
MRNRCVSLRNHFPKGHHPLRTSVFLRIGALLRRNCARLRKIRIIRGGGNWHPPRSLRILAHSCVFIAYFARRRHVTQFYAYYAGLRIHFKTLEKKKITQCSRRRRRREQNDKLMSGRREKSPECHGTNMVSV